jgi:hypothetical protein
MNLQSLDAKSLEAHAGCFTQFIMKSTVSEAVEGCMPSVTFCFGCHDPRMRTTVLRVTFSAELMPGTQDDRTDFRGADLHLEKGRREEVKIIVTKCPRGWYLTVGTKKAVSAISFARSTRPPFGPWPHLPLHVQLLCRSVLNFTSKNVHTFDSVDHSIHVGDPLSKN